MENQNREKKDIYSLRFPDGLRDKIKVAAARNRRSMNAEIIFHLEHIYEEAETA